MNYPFEIPTKIEAPGNHFRHQYDSLDTKIQKKVDELIKEFESGQLKPSRQIKIYSECKNCFEARVDLKHRFVYKLNSTSGIPIAVGSHDEVKRKAKDTR